MKMSIDDPRFAERIREEDPEALRAVVTSYLGQIHRAARSAGLDPERAEEVTQATFTTFIEKARNFEGRSHVRTWLFGILYHYCPVDFWIVVAKPDGTGVSGDL